ncbi:acyltransferase family protein [Duganella sp. S19_KUP01_CR8]|uniref:acyltransferase family protein n=1 Tax=Duganella sp. S19_KUP01_CR8 TaxID=3025502 RepID=UPI002FCDA002
MQIEKLPPAPYQADPAPALHPAYRRDIDGLRALAVLSVVLYHAFPSRLPGGFAGVDIFFIISGFLIGSILIAGMQQNAFSFTEFYARRVRRIFPALTVVLSACLAFGWFALFPDEYKMLGKHVFGGAGFLSNFFLWNEVGYFDTAAETKPLLHLWSLGIEEQFYIFWPVLMLLAWKRRFSLVALALGVAVLSFLVNVGGLHKFPSATFYSPASRVWELLYGSVLAYMSINGLHLFAGVRRGHGADAVIDWSSPRARNIKSALGLGLLLATLALLRADRHFPGWWALLPTTGAVLLISAGPQAWCNRVLLGNPVAVWFGLISYPLYLWHWPLLAFARIIESGLPSSKIRGAAVLAAIVLAWLTYRLLERPLRGTAHGRAKVAVLSAAMLALAAAGGALYRANGLPLRASVVDSAAQQKELFVVEDVPNATACKARYGFTSIYEYCLMDDPTKAPTVAMLGDSHAFHIWAGLNRYYHSRGENLVYFGTRVPFVNLPVGDDPYQKVVPMMIDKVMQATTVKTVIISTFARLNIEDEGGKKMTQALHDTLAMFVASGRKVIYVSDTPYLDFEPRSCIRRGAIPTSQTRTDCSLPRAKQDQQIARHKVAEQQALRDLPMVQVFDAAAQLCDAQRCLVMRENKMMYRDTHHLSHEGDLFMGERYGRQMDALKAAH